MEKYKEEQERETKIKFHENKHKDLINQIKVLEERIEVKNKQVQRLRQLLISDESVKTPNPKTEEMSIDLSNIESNRDKKFNRTGSNSRFFQTNRTTAEYSKTLKAPQSERLID